VIGKRRSLRLYVRWGCFLLAILLLLPFPYWAGTSRVFVQASSFVAICTILAARAFQVPSILGLVFSAIALVRKRWFCRYVCPVGLLLDGVSGVRSPVKTWWKGCPPIGNYIVWITIAGAIVGYPLFLWMDPLALLNNAFSVVSSKHILSVLLSLSGIVLLLLMALTSGDLWCARICPLGAIQDLLQSTGSFCRKFTNPKGKGSQKTLGPGTALPGARRQFIAIAAGLGLSLWAQKPGQARSQNGPLRPPGAKTESVFTGQCIRCGNCIRVCPSHIIHPDTGQSGILGFLSPIVRFEAGYCKKECNACTRVCPSGALQPLGLEQKNRYVIGTAQLDNALCLYGTSDCRACMNACKFDSIKVYFDKEAYESYPIVDPLKCNGCGACEMHCPTPDIKAIKVVKMSNQGDSIVNMKSMLRPFNEGRP
jgi:ferredoxin-type protein NapF